MDHSSGPAVFDDGGKSTVLAEPCDEGDANSAKRAISLAPEVIDTLSHEWAEGYARLDPDKAPGDVPPRRWQQFIDDTRRFLDGPFYAAAVALGWGSLDLFGSDATRPYARIDRAGLLWLVNGHRLIALTAMTAVIEMTITGPPQTYTRKASEFGRVLAWDLMTEATRPRTTGA